MKSGMKWLLRHRHHNRIIIRGIYCIRTLKSAAYSMLKRAAGIEKRDLDIVAKELFT